VPPGLRTPAASGARWCTTEPAGSAPPRIEPLAEALEVAPVRPRRKRIVSRIDGKHEIENSRTLACQAIRREEPGIGNPQFPPPFVGATDEVGVTVDAGHGPTRVGGRQFEHPVPGAATDVQPP